MPTERARIRNERGAALLETAITLPIILMICVGIFEFGRAYQTWQVLTNAAREGARVAVINGHDRPRGRAPPAHLLAASESGNAGTAPIASIARSAGLEHRHRAFTIQIPVPLHLLDPACDSWAQQPPPAAVDDVSGRHHAERKLGDAMRNRIFAVLAIAVLAGGGLAMRHLQHDAEPAAKPWSMRQDAAGRRGQRDLSLGGRAEDGRPQGGAFPRGQAPEGRLPSRGDRRPRRDRPHRQERADPAAKLASKEAGAGLPPVIPEGMRAVSVRSTRSSASPATCCPARAST